MKTLYRNRSLSVAAVAALFALLTFVEQQRSLESEIDTDCSLLGRGP